MEPKAGTHWPVKSPQTAKAVRLLSPNPTATTTLRSKKEKPQRELPGSLGVRTAGFHYRGLGSIPGWEPRSQKLHSTAKQQQKEKPQSTTDTWALEQNRPKSGVGAPGHRLVGSRTVSAGQRAWLQAWERTAGRSRAVETFVPKGLCCRGDSATGLERFPLDK